MSTGSSGPRSALLREGHDEFLAERVDVAHVHRQHHREHGRRRAHLHQLGDGLDRADLPTVVVAAPRSPGETRKPRSSSISTTLLVEPDSSASSPGTWTLVGAEHPVEHDELALVEHPPDGGQGEVAVPQLLDPVEPVEMGQPEPHGATLSATRWQQTLALVEPDRPTETSAWRASSSIVQPSVGGAWAHGSQGYSGEGVTGATAPMGTTVAVPIRAQGGTTGTSVRHKVIETLRFRLRRGADEKASCGPTNDCSRRSPIDSPACSGARQREATRPSG